MPKEKPKPEQVRVFKTTIRGTETIIYDRKGKPRKLQRMRRYRKPLIYEEFEMKRNPEKITIARIGKNIELFTYKNNKGFFIGFKEGCEYFEREDTSKVLRGACLLGRYFGILKANEAKRKHFERRKRNINIKEKDKTCG